MLPSAMISPRDGVYLGHLGPIPLYVHWSALVMVMMVMRVANTSSGFDVPLFLLMLTVLVMGIVLHELGHGLTAKALGAFGVSITLWAFGGLCSSTRDALPRRELMIIAAGPAVSFLLAGLGWGGLELVANYQPELLSDDAGHPSVIMLFLYYTYVINLWMGVFNILPIYPLDGGQIVYHLTHLLTGKQLIARQVCLTLAVFGAVGYLAYRVHMNGGQFDNSMVDTTAMMGFLVYNAFGALR
jgi:Zn-dependent protease